MMSVLHGIDTARLELTPWCADDLDELHRLWMNPSVRRYLWDDVIITRERAEEVVRASIADASEGLGQWTARVRGGAPVIGFAGFRRFGEPSATDIELLYGLHPDHWGRGLATEAARAVVRYGFETLGMTRIFAGADPPNAASFRVMKMLGMTLSSRRDHGAVYYSLDRSSFQSGDSPYVLRQQRSDEGGSPECERMEE